LKTLRLDLAKVLGEKAAPVPEGSDQPDKWEGINEIYERYSTHIGQIFELDSVFVSIISLYVQTFGVFKLNLSLIPSICHSSMQVLSEISAFNTLMK